MTTITINHGSYQVSRETTELNVNESYVQFQLAKNIESYDGEDFNYNSFWAEVQTDGKYNRYHIRNNEFENYLSF